MSSSIVSPYHSILHPPDLGGGNHRISSSSSSLSRLNTCQLRLPYSDRRRQERVSFPTLCQALSSSSQESNVKLVTGEQQEAPPPPDPPKKLSAWSTTLAIGSLFCAVLPFYNKLTVIENVVENFVIRVADVVEEAAPMVKKIAEEIEETLPKDSKLIAKLDLIEKLADDVAEGAEKAEAVVRKVDEIFDKVEDKVNPYLGNFKKADNNK